MSVPVTFLRATRRRGRPLISWLTGLVMAGLLACSSSSFSQALKPAVPASSSAGAKAPLAAPAKATSRPAWSELTPLQRQALAPLASNWNTISESQKRKWLEISKNYSSLPPEGQATLNSRMHEWVTLSPQERAQARLNFGKTKELSRQLTSEEKNAKWQAYQALSPEEKQKLAAKASPRPSGAATAVKPVAPQKLVTVPAHANKPGNQPTLKMAPPPAATPAVTAIPPTLPGAGDGAVATPQR
ncbi:MAG: DUF3106 domain-containing protein [Polaromonas sp.]